MEIKPQAMALPKETDHLEKGKYGPILPKTPACYGFTIIAKIIPGREPVFYEYAKNIEKTLAGVPDYLAPLKLLQLGWVLFPIKGETYFMYQRIFDTDYGVTHLCSRRRHRGANAGDSGDSECFRRCNKLSPWRIDGARKPGEPHWKFYRPAVRTSGPDRSAGTPDPQRCDGRCALRLDNTYDHRRTDGRLL